MTRRGDVSRLGKLLPEALEEMGAAGAWNEARVRSVWDEAVGERVASRCRIHRLRGATLEVEVEEDTWATELRYLADVITERVNERSGSKLVREVVVRRARRRNF